MTILSLPELRASSHPLLEGHDKIAKSLADTKGQARWRAFLSYRSLDRETAFAAAELLKSAIEGLSIYVDVEDSDLCATPSATMAKRLKTKISECDLLIVAVTSKSPDSRWIPWELGVADGGGRRAAVLPCVENPKDYGGDGLEFRGQEYLGVYPWLDIHVSTVGTTRTWANTKRDVYVVFEDWMKGEAPFKRR